jgi:hypothetical protein
MSVDVQVFEPKLRMLHNLSASISYYPSCTIISIPSTPPSGWQTPRDKLVAVMQQIQTTILQ